MEKSKKYVVSALYKFVRLENYKELKSPLLKCMQYAGVKGTLLLAEEGINGTIAGSQKGIDSVINWLEALPEMGEISHKESYHDDMPFYRTKVKLKKEIVTLGVDGISPTRDAGEYVKPEDWNQLISREDVVLVDTRNDYEYEIGTFKGAVNPETDTFREFPEYVEKNLDNKKHKNVAMFCTGGIRCEKSTSLLKNMGFENVYHLEGGILKYLEKVNQEDSMWDGECFVFDERVAVDHSLNKGKYSQCYACRFPITDEDKNSHLYEKGVSCPRCHDNTTDFQKLRFSEREKQMELAKQRGESHIG